MTAPLVTIFCLISFMFLIVGGVVGWLWKEHVVYASPQQIMTHPEMFDNHGNVIPDEIIAVRFENDYDYDEDDNNE